MKNQTKKVTLIVFLAFLLLFTLFSYLHYSTQTISSYCLKEKAESYCKELNLSFGNIRTDLNRFSCILVNKRIGDEYSSYYLLKGEIKDCIVKEAYSWRKNNE